MPGIPERGPDCCRVVAVRPETQNLRAGRLLLARIGELAQERADFGFETTLSGRNYVKLLTDMKAGGYQVELFFLCWLSVGSACIGRSKNKRSKIMKKASENPHTKLADAAFRQAAQKVIKRAKESGTPVIIWEDGEVKRVEPRNTRKTRKRNPEN